MKQRIIKFRGWNGKGWTGPDAIYLNGGDAPNFELEHKFSGLKLMQFTGLLDKNGKEIYEEDVCRFTERSDVFKTSVGLVKYIGSSFKGFVDDPEDALPIDSYYEFEVIGNIYENPELLNPNA